MSCIGTEVMCIVPLLCAGKCAFLHVVDSHFSARLKAVSVVLGKRVYGAISLVEKEGEISIRSHYNSGLPFTPH